VLLNHQGDIPQKWNKAGEIDGFSVLGYNGFGKNPFAVIRSFVGSVLVVERFPANNCSQRLGVKEVLDLRLLLSRQKWGGNRVKVLYDGGVGVGELDWFLIA
jgi:hypothetical protein